MVVRFIDTLVYPFVVVWCCGCVCYPFAMIT